jgi:FkbM family methyltransferase
MFSDFEPRIVRQESCGVKFNSIIADRVAELWYDTPRHETITVEQARSLRPGLDRKAPAEWKEMGILRDFVVRPGDRVVECGCHHGLTTIMLASWIGEEGFISAFDAVPLNVVIARRNLDLNGIGNAAAYCAAIGGKCQLVNCFNESNVVVKPGERVLPSSTIMVRLEDVVQSPVDVLKLDVEGCELDILESSASLVSTIPRLAIELHTDLLPHNGAARILEILKPRALHILWESGEFAEYSGQLISERVHLFAI